MEEAGRLISVIENKIRRLVEEHQKLLEENNKLTENIRSLNNKINEHKATINELETKNKLFRITKTLESKVGTADAKAKINELVREIDKCIGLLNI